MVDQGEMLWRHTNPQSTEMWRFKVRVETKYGLLVDSYEDLRQWSIANISSFWEEVWDFTGIVAAKKFDRVGTRSSSNMRYAASSGLTATRSWMVTLQCFPTRLSFLVLL